MLLKSQKTLSSLPKELRAKAKEAPVEGVSLFAKGKPTGVGTNAVALKWAFLVGDE